MFQRVSAYDFEAAFKVLRPNRFTQEALVELYEYYEELEEDTGEQIELDVIAICGDWSEYTAAELIRAYAETHGIEGDDYDDEEEHADAVAEALKDETTVLRTRDGSFVVGVF